MDSDDETEVDWQESHVSFPMTVRFQSTTIKESIVKKFMSTFVETHQEVLVFFFAQTPR
jgi:hypothetical protein